MSALLAPTHRWIPALALVAGLAATRTAAAQEEVSVGGTIALELRTPDPADPGAEDPNYIVRSDEERRRYFNRANCVCGVAADGSLLDVEDGAPAFQVRFLLTPDDTGSDSEQNLDVWVGTNCTETDSAQRERNCDQIESAGVSLPDLREVPQHDATISVAQLINSNLDLDSNPDAERCEEQTSTRNVFGQVDPAGDGFSEGDYSVSFEAAINIDTQAPTMVDGVVASGGERSITVTWDLSASATDYEFFQLLCERVDGDDDSHDDGIDPEYTTAERACGRADEVAEASSLELLPALTEGMRTLDPSFLCGSASAGSSVSATGLTNGAEYRVVLVAVDFAGNPRALDLGVVSPTPAQDFWEDYKDQGGTAAGGCAAGGGAGPLAALGALVALAGARRRRRAAGGAALAIVAIVAVGRPAAAQPYLETDRSDEPSSFGLPPRVDWNLDLEMGPYVPAIDDSAGVDAHGEGPFAHMFGEGPFLLSQATLDRFFLHRFGLLGVYGSIGFLTTSANAYLACDPAEITDRARCSDAGIAQTPSGKNVRSASDTTRFRMVPMSLGVVYRYDGLDELAGIPVVPYGRLGLSYYAWWVTQPSGELAEAPDDDCADPGAGGCEGDVARGGSLGWQGSIGVAIRAERLDADAEASLRNELGIAHAGVFAELTYADVDGFGDAEKLPLGDVTWSAGLTFEF